VGETYSVERNEKPNQRINSADHKVY